MEIGKQIQGYRQKANLSQEALAEKIFVTRQTVSNWETARNYPDINSLVLLSALFDVSLDILVKGDLETMKEEIKTEDIKKLRHESNIFTVLLIACVALVVPMTFCGGLPGFVAWLALYAVTMWYAVRIEKQKKEHDIQTYKEVLAFIQGKQLDEIQKNREDGKRPYQKLLYVLGAMLITFVVAGGMYLLMEKFLAP